MAQLLGLVTPQMGWFMMQLWGALSLIVMEMLLIHSVNSLGEPPVYFAVHPRPLIIVSVSIKQHLFL